MGIGELALAATGFVFVGAGCLALSGFLAWPMTDPALENTPLTEIRNPVELAWQSLRRSIRPALIVTAVSAVLNILVRAAFQVK